MGSHSRCGLVRSNLGSYPRGWIFVRIQHGPEGAARWVHDSRARWWRCSGHTPASRRTSQVVHVGLFGRRMATPLLEPRSWMAGLSSVSRSRAWLVVASEWRLRPNQSLQQTAAAIAVSRSLLSLSAAAAAERSRYALLFSSSDLE